MRRDKARLGGKDKDSCLAKYIVLAAVIINFILLIPLFPGWCLVSGDGTAHYSAAQQLLYSIEAGKGVFGSWNDSWTMGFPGYNYYQYLGHLIIVIIHFLSFKILPLLVIEKLLIVLAVAFFPVSLYYGMRKLRLAPLPAAFAALFSFALSSSVGHGDMGFSMVNHGLFTQVIALFIFPLALARVYFTLCERRGYFLSALLASSVLLIHPIVGYALCISSAIFLFDKESRSSWQAFIKRLASFLLVFCSVGVIVAHFYVPYLRGGDYAGTKFFLNTQDYYQSSMPQVLFDLFSGRTLDFFRWPFALMTLFFFIGIYAAGVKKDDADFPRFFALTGLTVFLMISFGKGFWGSLFDLLPGMGHIIVFRLVFALQFFMLFFVGAGVATLFAVVRRAGLRRIRSSAVLLCLFLVVLALPVFAQLMLSNHKLCSIANEGFDAGSFSKLSLFLRNSPDSRFIARPELGFSMPYYESLLPIYTGHPSFSTSSMGSQDNLAYYYTQFFMLPNQGFYDLYNIRYALFHSDKDVSDPFLKQAFVSGNYTVYTTGASGYFGLVDASTAAVYDGSMNSDFVRQVSVAWLNTRAMENQDFVAFFRKGSDTGQGDFSSVIQESGNTLSAEQMKRFFKDLEANGLPSCGDVVEESRSAGFYSASLEVNRSCYLLLKVSYHPAWKSFVDGKSARLYALSPSFMAVRVEPGDGSAEFYYSPDNSLRHWLMAFGAFVLIGLLLYDLGSSYSRKVSVFARKR